MPAARLRRRSERVDHVVVRRSGADGVEEVDAIAVGPIPDQTVPVHDVPDRANERRHMSSPSPSPTRAGNSPPPLVVTLTLNQNQEQATGVVREKDEGPTETVVVAITGVPSQPPLGGHPDGHRGGISATTQHLLIAAGSIGATILIVMIILGIHTMRKRGLTISQALRAGRYQVTHGGPPPPPKQNEYRDQKHANEYGSMRSVSVATPEPAKARPGSQSSQRPLIELERSDSFSLNRQNSNRSATSNTQPKTFLLESPPLGRKPSHRRNESGTPSSNALGSNDNEPRRSASTHNTRSIDDEEAALEYTDPPSERPASTLPPPPSFKQFLTNRPSISGKVGGGNFMSRFSWTNSQAPQTPHEPTRESTAQVQSRESYMTSRSSVPRFRTIDSWVNQQTNRLEADKLKEQFRLTSTSVYSEDSEARDTVPEVPAMPKNVQALRESSAALSSQLPNRRPVTPPGLPGRNVKHQRHNTGTTVDTAPIFRQHPGTEVRFSTKSAVPSEILDRGRNDTVLS